MKPSRLSLAAVLLALPLPATAAWSSRVGAPPAQETGPPRVGQEDDPPRDIFGREIAPATGTEAHQKLMGCWQLIDLQIQGFPGDGRRGDGVLLVGEDFLSLELHLAWGQGAKAIDVHQSLIGEYRLAQDGRLSVATVIGSYFDPETGRLEYEPAGLPREYHVLQGSRTLTLEFGVSDRMTFAERRGRLSDSHDIFGRATGANAPTRDVFGRPLRQPAKAPEEKGDGGR